MELIMEEMGQTLLALAVGGAMVSILIVILNVATAF